MFRRLLLSLTLLSGSLALTAQVTDVMNYRTFDGTNNNVQDPSLGANHTALRQATTVAFSDGYSSPGGETRPNPRVISNALFAQDDNILNDPIGLSATTWVWGQFIDHDVALTEEVGAPLMIPVPAGDEHLDPFGTGEMMIPMTRNAPMAGTGTEEGNPRLYANEISAFIDGSLVYGSDQDRADWLRSFEKGKLKVSAGDMLPYNTTTGEYNDPLDLTAPHMANATEISLKSFVAGDIRAGENPLLAAFHTLFVREHNRQCDVLAQQSPEWTDEQLYQHARKIVSGQIQAITYEEWLPAMGVTLPPYTGYQANVNPQLMNVFSAAAFRMGHTLLNSNILRLDNEGEVILQGNLTLRDAFFNPFVIQETGSLDPFFKGIATQVQQEFDSKVIDDVRNFLFGEPGFGGLDLVSININRGRDRGLTDFNTIRADFGLPRYNFFQQINPDASVFTRLLSTYVNINEIDPWVGMLAERPMPGTIFGQTVLEIMTRQFQDLRDGDRFYYENDPVLTEAEKAKIKATTLRDVIMYNSDITLLQDNIFGALPHAEICDNMTLNLNGLVRTFEGEPLNGARIELTSSTSLETQQTDATGTYTFSAMPFCDLDVLLPQKNDDFTNGVTTFDLIIIQNHILAVDTFDDPYQWIAADVNASGTVSTLDLIRIRKLILGVETDFGGNTSWRFVLAAFQFPADTTNPLAVDFPELLDFQTEHAADYNSGFLAIKVGDVNRSANASNATTSEDKTFASVGLSLQFNDQWIEAGAEATFELTMTPQQDLAGWQFELASDAITFVDAIPNFDAALQHWTEDYWRVSYTPQAGIAISQTVSLTLAAKETGWLSELLAQGTDLASEAYPIKQREPAAIVFEVRGERNASMEGVASPNPFAQATNLAFEQKESGTAYLYVYSADGKVVLTEQDWMTEGTHQWQLDRTQLPAAGLWRAQIVTNGNTYNYQLVLQ